MKPSGIEWIGDIPEDWEVKKVKRLFSYQKGKNAALLTKEYISLHPGEYPVLSGQTENDGILGYYESYEFDLDKDSIFVTTVGAKAMSTKLVNAKFSLSQNCALLHKIDEKADVRFLHYALFPMFEWQKSMISLIMQPSLRFEDLDKATLPYPPLKTQERIADYLDKKCGEIDATIAKQKESIEKLKAYKQSLISETVTKGLDKSAPLKPSGIDYLGNIPSHWEIKKLKYVAKLDPAISEFLSDNDIVSFAPMECLGEQTLSPYETEYGKVKGKYTYFANEDIIMAKVTPCFENGNIAIAKNLKNNVGFGSSELFVFRTKSVSNSFLMYTLYSEPFKSLAKSTMYGTGGLKRVSPNFILNYKIPLPPLKAQESIADYLDSKCSQIDKYITEKQNIIQKLDAYKKSLIFECVTGKRLV